MISEWLLVGNNPIRMYQYFLIDFFIGGAEHV